MKKNNGLSFFISKVLLLLVCVFLAGCSSGGSDPEPNTVQDDPVADSDTPAVSIHEFTFPDHLKKTGCVYTEKQIDRNGDGISEKTYSYEYNGDGYILIEEELNDELIAVSSKIHTYVNNRIDKIEYYNISNGVPKKTRTKNYQYYKDEDDLYTLVELNERSWTSTHYDNDGQKIKHYYYNGGDNYFSSYIYYEYDDSGYEIKASEYENGDSYEPTKITYNAYNANTGFYETSFDYGANGELIKQSDIAEGVNDSLGKQERTSTETMFDDGSKQTLSTVVTIQDDGISVTKYISTLRKYNDEGYLIAREKDYGNNGENIQITRYSNYECFN